LQSILKYGVSGRFFSTLHENFFITGFRKVFKANGLSPRYPGRPLAKYCQRRTYTQSILEYRLSWSGLQAGAGCLWQNDFAMRMRTSPLCAFYGEGQGYPSHGKGLGCGKGEESVFGAGRTLIVPAVGDLCYTGFMPNWLHRYYAQPAAESGDASSENLLILAARMPSLRKSRRLGQPFRGGARGSETGRVLSPPLL
jgi:hypothetical protein